MNTSQANPAMPSENQCPRCGAALSAGALAGLCPACLLKQGAAADTAPLPGAVPFTPPSVAELVKLFPQLEILSLIGQGGMGAVYKARQKQLDRIVALKILPPAVSHDPKFAERFAREARALAKLNHPNIVTLYEFGQADGLFYFLMEFMDGMNLRQLLNAGRVTPKEALAIVPPICDALQFAHDRGIVHRDIKPENILLSKEGQVKIADFGVAKIVASESATTATSGTVAPLPAQTDASLVMGTPQYMAPEQTKHPSEVDHRADIYSLGVVFYQMLTGELPKGKFEPPSKKVVIDVRLDEVVLRALEKEPARRYQQVSEVKTQVETIATTPPSPGASAQTVPASAPAAGQTWQSPTMGWGHFIGYLFGITFTSPLAFKCANLSALGFLGFLGSLSFLGYGPPEWHWCFGFSGFFGLFGLFGLIGVAFVIEMVARGKRGEPSARHFVVVGRRGGTTVVNWPGVLLSFVLMLAIMEVATIVASLVLEERINTNAILATFFFALMITGIRIRRGQTMPVDQLVSLDTPVVAAPLAVGFPASSKLAQHAANPLPVLQFWQALEDGDYARAWERAAPYFQRDVGKDEWMARMDRNRRPLGKAVQRGQPTVHWLNVGARQETRCKTTFGSGRNAMETAVAALQPNGEWRIESYRLDLVEAAPTTPPSTTGSLPARQELRSSRAAVFMMTVVLTYTVGLLGGTLLSVARVPYASLCIMALLILTTLGSPLLAFLVSRFATLGAQRTFLKTGSILAIVMALPLAGFGMFFLYAFSAQGFKWNPAPDEAIIVPLIWLGAILLPICAWRLWGIAMKPLDDAQPSGPGAANGIAAKNLPLFVEQDGRRQLYWPGVLMFCGTLGVAVLGVNLAIALVVWLVTAEPWPMFLPRELPWVLVLMAVCVVMRMAALKLGASDAARAAATPAAEVSTARRVILALLVMIVAAVVAAGSALLTWAWARQISATALDSASAWNDMARMAVWIAIAVAIGWFIFHRVWRAAGKPRLPLVGARDGKRVIHWPAVWIALLQIGMIVVVLWFAGASTSIVVFITLLLLLKLAIALFWGWAMPFEQLSKVEPQAVTTTRCRGRRLLLEILIGLVIAVALREWVIAPYYAVSDSAAPEILRRSYVLVYKLARSYAPGDIVVYQAAGKATLGRVAQTGPLNDALQVERRNQPPQSVPISSVIGKVVFNTRPAAPPPRAPQATTDAPAVKSVVVSVDRAVIKQRAFHGEGMIIAFGMATNRWTPRTAYLDHMFEVAVDGRWFSDAANWVVKTRHGINMSYNLDGPPGPMRGKIVFQPGQPAPEADGSYVIGEFRPETGAPLPIAVRLETSGKQTAVPAEPKPAARLQFRLVADASDSAPADTLADPGSKESLRVRKEVLLDETAVARAAVVVSPAARSAVSVEVEFDQAGAKRFAEITGANIGKRLAVVFDGKLLSAPTIRSVIRDKAVITGNFTAVEVAEAIANALNAPDMTQDVVKDIQPDGTIRFKTTITQRNTTGELLKTLRFSNSDFIRVDKLSDARGRPLAFTVKRIGQVTQSYEATLIEPVAPGAEFSYVMEGTEIGLVMRLPRPGEFQYTMRHWPGTRTRTHRIERHLLPVGARLLSKTPAELAERTRDGRIELFIDRLIPDGDSLEISYRWTKQGE